MPSLEQIVITLGLFGILVTAYGIGVGGVDVATSYNNIFTSPFPDLSSVLNAPQQNCSVYDIRCNAANLSTATAQIALAIEYPGIVIFNILGKIVAFGSLLLAVLFGPAVGAASVPFLNLFIPLMILVGGFELFRMFRGNASGGTL